MEWWQAYLLWKMTALQGVAILLMVLTAIALVVTFCYRYDSDSRNGTAVGHWVRVAVFSTLFVVFLGLGTMIPDTRMVMKIVATKYMVDGATSETISEKLERIDKLVDDGITVLEQKLNEAIEDEE